MSLDFTECDQARLARERALRLIVEEGALDQEGATVERLAQRLGVGSRQLTRLFARYIQASPSKVARTARVQRAKRLLDETSLPMTEIAMRAGFGSLRRFNSVFVEVYGRPPTEIRRTRRSAGKEEQKVEDAANDNRLAFVAPLAASIVGHRASQKANRRSVPSAGS
jgi:AraC-like DNA-binding protein